MTHLPEICIVLVGLVGLVIIVRVVRDWWGGGR